MVRQEVLDLGLITGANTSDEVEQATFVSILIKIMQSLEDSIILRSFALNK